jgi:AraC-like DNA-binding protein
MLGEYRPVDAGGDGGAGYRDPSEAEATLNALYGRGRPVNAAESISISDTAAAADVTPRALQYGFARHHDTSPTAYLRKVRLARAQRDPQAADPSTGATVADVAAQWGFSRPVRFTASYQRQYGVLPGQTLRA